MWFTLIVYSWHKNIPWTWIQVRISFSNVIYQYLESISLVVKYSYFIIYNIHIIWLCVIIHASLMAQVVKRLPAMRETWVWSLGWEDLEKEMATHSSTLAWKTPWTEEPGRLQTMGSQRVGHDWVTSLSQYVVYDMNNIHDINNMDNIY